MKKHLALLPVLLFALGSYAGTRTLPFAKYPAMAGGPVGAATLSGDGQSCPMDEGPSWPSGSPHTFPHSDEVATIYAGDANGQ
jgi:hypothetical protein